MKLLIMALAPVVVIFSYVYYRDYYEREPIWRLVKSFTLGLLIAIPVVWLGGKMQDMLPFSRNADLFGIFVHAFVVVALVEEGMKFLVLRYYCFPKEDFDEPYDGIMYGVAVSLGFAAIENVIYVFTSGDPLRTAMLRMFTAVPAHAVFGVVMGYYMGRAKFALRGRSLREMYRSLVAAVLLHGLYDFFLFLNIRAMAVFSLLLIPIGIWLSHRAMRRHKAWLKVKRANASYHEAP